MQTSWKNVALCIKTLLRCRLVPRDMLEVDDFVTGRVLLVAARDTKKNQKRDTSLFSAFSSLLYAQEPDDEGEIEEQGNSHKTALACVVSCKISDLFEDSKWALSFPVVFFIFSHHTRSFRFLQEDSLASLMRALIQASQVVNEKRRGFTPRGEESQIGGDKDSTAEGWTEVKKDIVVGGQTSPLTLYSSQS